MLYKVYYIKKYRMQDFFQNKKRNRYRKAERNHQIVIV